MKLNEKKKLQLQKITSLVKENKKIRLQNIGQKKVNKSEFIFNCRHFFSVSILLKKKEKLLDFPIFQDHPVLISDTSLFQKSS